jgi:multiple sugar transport system permease protein
MPIMMGEVYEWQFALQDRKVAAAYALIILAISIGFTLFFLFSLRTRDEARV